MGAFFFGQELAGKGSETIRLMRVRSFTRMHFLDMFFKTIRTYFGIAIRTILHTNRRLFPMCFLDMLLQTRLGNQGSAFLTARHAYGHILHAGGLCLPTPA